MTLAMLAACPTMYVATGHGSERMVSMIASPSVIEPPGLFTYMLTSAFGSSFARNSSCAVTDWAIARATGPPTNTTRSRSIRL